MCIMEIHPGQLASTMVQACAHNISTVDRDIDMFKGVLAARGRTELLQNVEDAHAVISVAYEKLLQCFADEVQREVAVHGEHAHPDHAHDHHGTERSLAEQAHHDAELARRFETR